MRTLTVENELLRLACLIDKGSDIMELIYKPLDIDLMWHSPIGYRNPIGFVASCPSAGGAFIDFYGGGWQDILPSAGKPAKNKGAEWGFHGETALIPWDCRITRADKEEAEAYLSVEGYRYPFRLEKRISMGINEAKITIKERLTNISEQELEFSWLQHPAFGEPLLAPGSRIFLPSGEVVVRGPEEDPYGRLREGRYKWPRAIDRGGDEVDLSVIPGKKLMASETSFITNLKEGWYALVNPKLNLGFGLTWNREIFDWLWFWQNYNTPDYPWYGRAWNIALEPCTSFPGGLDEQIKEGTSHFIRGMESIETELTAVVFMDLTEVKQITPDGKVT